MESVIIWTVTLLLAAGVFLFYFLRFRKQQAENYARKQEAIRLGADRAIAQHPQIDVFSCIGCGACIDACPEGEVLGLVSGKATIINGLKCVGHGLCAEACPVEGITVGLGDIRQRDDIPVMNEYFETNRPGIFIAGELSGLALLRNAISQGQQVVRNISQLYGDKRGQAEYDVLIIGAGPAGLSAGMTAIEQNLSYLIIDQQDLGGTILQYPRKKLVLTRPVEIPLYGWLDRNEYSKEELLDIWRNIQRQYALQLKISEKLLNIHDNGNQLQVVTDKGQYSAVTVVLALGRRGTPRKLNVPGEDRSKVMYKLLDASHYQNEHLLIVGGGDSAIEAAIGLARQKGNRVTISYRKDRFFRIKSRNEQRLQEYVKRGKIEVLFNSQVEEIKENEVQIKYRGESITLPNNYTFIFAGGEPPFRLLKNIGIQFGSSEQSAQ